MNLSQFDRDAEREAERVVAQGREAITSAALQLYADLQAEARTAGGYGSPVASGRLAASMRVGINEIDHSYEAPDPNYEYPSGSGARELPPRTIPNRAISQVAAKLRGFKLGDRIFISNSVPYIRKIEIGGHSWQTPDGVFAPTVRNFMRKFRNIRVGVRNG